MSDMQYGIDISIRNGISNLKKFKKAADSFDKGREAALKRQIALLQKMKNLQAQVAKPMPRPSPSTSSMPPKPSSSDDFIGPRIDKNTQNFLKKQAKERLATEQRLTKEKMRQERIESARLSSLEKTKATIMNSALMTEKEANAAQRAAQERIRSRLSSAKTTAEMRKIVAQERASLRLAKKKSFLVSRMEASSKEFAGNMVSAFAVAAGGAFITKTGQDLEAVSNTMLTVSGNSELAAENLEFVKDQAMRLGVGFKESSKQYAKMVAAQGDLSDTDLRESFLGMAEMSTVLGLSADESGRAFTALTQIMSKGQVMSEELKGQLGEVMPNALQVMAKAAMDAGISTDGSVKSLMKLMEDGKVMADDVLPHFSRRLRETAATGLDKAMDSNRVAMNRLVNATQIAANTIFTSGWGEGLTVLFNSLAEMIKENETLFTEFGKTMGKVFKGLAWLVENVLDPALGALGSILQFANESIGGAITAISGLTAMLVKMSPVLSAVVERFGGLKTIGKAIGFIARRMFLPFYLGLGVLEEIAEFFSPTGKKTLLRFNINDIANPFESWREDIDYIWDKMMAIGKVFGMGSTQDIGTTRGVLPYNHEAFMQPRQQSVFQPSQAPIHVTVDIDGNKVAEAVATKPAMAESVNRAMNKAFDPNYR